MTTRSRLGRDPLRDVAPPPAGETAAPATTTKAKIKAKTPSKTLSQGTPAQKRPGKTNPPVEPLSPPSATPDVLSEMPQPAAAPGMAPVKTIATPPATAVAAPCPATAPTVVEDTHPIAIFLSGVLEGLLPDDAVQFSITVDPEASALPVEKLFYFSHVLQLLVSPLDWPIRGWRRPDSASEQRPALTARLRRCAEDRHTLRLYDNGHFFRSYLPDMRLEMEALRPLVCFVVKRQGSICMKQGRFIEFEITG